MSDNLSTEVSAHTLNPTGIFVEAKPHFLGLIRVQSDVCGNQMISDSPPSPAQKGRRPFLADFRGCHAAPFSLCLPMRCQEASSLVLALIGLQVEYSDWLEALPDNQEDSATAEALRAIVELDFSDLQSIEPPRGFGRD